MGALQWVSNWLLTQYDRLAARCPRCTSLAAYRGEAGGKIYYTCQVRKTRTCTGWLSHDEH